MPEKAYVDQRVRSALFGVIVDFANEHEALRGTGHGGECGICWPLSEVLKMLDADQHRQAVAQGWETDDDA